MNGGGGGDTKWITRWLCAADRSLGRGIWSAHVRAQAILVVKPAPSPPALERSPAAAMNRALRAPLPPLLLLLLVLLALAHAPPPPAAAAAAPSVHGQLVVARRLGVLRPNQAAVEVPEHH